MFTVNKKEIKDYIEVPHFLLKENPQRNLVCFPADGGNHFLMHGIVENTICIFDTDLEFEPGTVSCFKSKDKYAKQKYKMADTYLDLDGYDHVGRLVATMRNCEAG